MASEPVIDLQIGDIFLRRNISFFGLVLYSIFPASKLYWPSKKYPKQIAIHSGIIGKHNGQLGIFESSYLQNFFFTPWENGLQLIQTGKYEIKTFRLPNFSETEKIRLNEYLNKKIKKNIGYDYLGSITLGIDTILRRTLFTFHSNSRWFCTEVLKYGYKHVYRDFFGLNLPTPQYIEELIQMKTFTPIADIYTDQHHNLVIQTT